MSVTFLKAASWFGMTKPAPPGPAVSGSGCTRPSSRCGSSSSRACSPGRTRRRARHRPLSTGEWSRRRRPRAVGLHAWTWTPPRERSPAGSTLAPAHGPRQCHTSPHRRSPHRSISRRARRRSDGASRCREGVVLSGQGGHAPGASRHRTPPLGNGSLISSSRTGGPGRPRTVESHWHRDRSFRARAPVGRPRGGRVRRSRHEHLAPRPGADRGPDRRGVRHRARRLHRRGRRDRRTGSRSRTRPSSTTASPWRTASSSGRTPSSRTTGSRARSRRAASSRGPTTGWSARSACAPAPRSGRGRSWSPAGTSGGLPRSAPGAVVTRDVPDHALVAGNPARRIGWVCACGRRLVHDAGTPVGADHAGEAACPACAARYDIDGDRCVARTTEASA